ncbi:MAG TPA: copper chaperone PCu(A)C [Acetobacteraceae bacterium]|nr:copper chaperone PCu(A)C [Acetobacteraceae bacterium]
MRRAILVAATLLTASPTLAQKNGLEIAHAWSRPASAGGVGVAYLTITDSGPPDRLTGASSPVAEAVELHRSATANGVATMRPVDGLPVEPGTPAVLKPGGYHLMLRGLKRPLAAGESFPLTLEFAKAGALTTTVTVAPLRAGAATGESNGMGGMHRH